jgi:hypothetical protein
MSKSFVARRIFAESSVKSVIATWVVTLAVVMAGGAVLMARDSHSVIANTHWHHAPAVEASEPDEAEPEIVPVNQNIPDPSEAPAPESLVTAGPVTATPG